MFFILALYDASGVAVPAAVKASERRGTAEVVTQSARNRGCRIQRRSGGRDRNTVFWSGVTAVWNINVYEKRMNDWDTSANH